MRGRAPLWRRLALGTAAVFAAAALAAALCWNSIFESALNSQIKLSPHSRAYKDWVAPTVPLLFDVYLFNWTNSDSFPQDKPNLEQIGPYRFRELREHVNVTFHPGNGSVSYRTQRSWYFDEEASNGTLQDNITILNVIAASAIYRSRHWGFLRQKGLSMALAMFGHGMTTSRLAGELMFEGFEDPLLEMAKNLPPSATGGAPQVDRFGLFYGRNNSMDTEGLVEVTTGDSGTLPGQILSWDYHKSLPWYEGECAKITGSGGEFMPHNLTEDEPLTIFMPDLCRTVHLEFERSGQLGGLPYNKYAMTDISFDNSTRSPANSCFCNGECGWGGVMNVSACRFGSPSFLSLPHFLHGDPELRERVRGMQPDPDLHSFYFAVEPRLGVPLDVAGRFQFNVFIEPNPHIALYENVPRMLFPIFWVEQRVKVSEPVFAELRAVRAILDWGGTVCACAAIVFASIVIVATCCTKKSQYSRPQEMIICEKPKDEAEMKLNSM